MFSLIIKDLLLLKKMVVFVAVYMLVLFFAFKDMPQAALYTGIVGSTYVLVATSLAYDDKNNSDIVLNSLPLSRSEIVLAKYLQIFLYALVGSSIFTIIVSILKLLNIDTGGIKIGFDTIATAIFSVVLMNSIYFPFFYKLGYIKSKYVNFVLFFTFFFLMQKLVKNIVSTENPSLLKAIDLFRGLSVNLLALLTLGGAVVIAVISYSLSLKFYRAREF
ncbi:ABC-2 transporter permease [Clostridium thermarum]|uniref:ABC-2 transporter permease n=1 Tax=Clostridium thermarum TaxID=1716543 RepID=UPI0013D2A0F8|nr:ABC-2 transporter permease [Clostridium thermarum]